MRNFVFLLVPLTASFYFFSCNSGAERKLTREDSLAICRAITGLKTDTTIHETIKKSVFTSGVNFAPRTVDQMRDLHQSYLLNPLDIFSEDDPATRVRYFEIPYDDIDKLTTAMGRDFGGLRIYFGYDGHSSPALYHLILTGIDKTTGANHLVDQEIFDDFRPCPNQCLESNTNMTAAKTDLNYDPVTRAFKHF